MSHTNRLSLRELREIHRILGEITELGSDVETWRRHLLDQTRKLLGARVAMSLDMTHGAGGHAAQLIAPVDVGWNDAAQQMRFYRYFDTDEVVVDPAAVALFAAMNRSPLVTANRCGLVEDPEWYRSPVVSESRRASDVDDFVVSTLAITPSLLHGFVFYRDWGDSKFTEKHRRIVRYLHVCLLRQMRRSITARKRLAAELELTPRLWETLQLLAEGQSMNAVAEKLGVSRHTLNGYTKILYRRLNVRSHIELMNQMRQHFRGILPIPQELLIGPSGAAGLH